MIVRENVALAPYTTFRIGGPARYLIEAESEDDVRDALAFAHEKKLPLFVLGGGSNILISDEGFNGVVLHSNLQGITSETRDNREWVTAGAGVSWDELVAWAVGKNLSGIECLSGVPGTVGGAVVANVGAYAAQVSDTFVCADVIDRRTANAKVINMKHDACAFSYHDSVFGRDPDRYGILSATFALRQGIVSLPRYKDSRFDTTTFTSTHHREPTLLEVREMIMAVRKGKGVLSSSYRSAGSFFHMPLVTRKQYEHIQRTAQELDAEKEEQLRPWAWEQPNGAHRIAPGFLLEYTEFKKGYRRGRVGISPRHTLTIINADDATAREVAELARDMQTAVKKIFDIKLEHEVEYVGEVEK